MNVELKPGNRIRYLGAEFTLVTDLGKNGWKAEGNGRTWTFKPEHIAQSTLVKSKKETV